jgi:uncharacterized protein (DUF1697 family)
LDASLGIAIEAIYGRAARLSHNGGFRSYDWLGGIEMKKKRKKKTKKTSAAPAATGRAASRRYVAFLRGVSPMNAKMPDLKRCFEAAGFADVKTVLSSGNVVFGARAAAESSIAKQAEGAMAKGLGRTFPVIVRSVDTLRALLASDPYRRFAVAPGAKRVVTFLKAPPKAKPSLPLELHGARILAIEGNEVFTAYTPSPRGPVFMTLIEKTFGKDVTTRTWDTVQKVAK